jgi:HPt (histidine-containing phosphotransfer) domain-containing protein
MTDQFHYTDLSYLEDISGGDETFMKEIVDLFIKQMPESVKTMREALANEDPVTIGETAHKAKPSAIYIGNKSLEENLRTLQELKNEKAIRNNTSELIEQVAQQSDNVIEELKTRFQ